MAEQGGLYPGMPVEAFRILADDLLAKTSARIVLQADEKQLLRSLRAFIRMATPAEIGGMTSNLQRGT